MLGVVLQSHKETKAKSKDSATLRHWLFSMLSKWSSAFLGFTDSWKHKKERENREANPKLES